VGAYSMIFRVAFVVFPCSSPFGLCHSPTAPMATSSWVVQALPFSIVVSC
jgi:hypothetical protein